jgi:hypothetical protein
MSSFTRADLKLGGRLVAACDAIGQAHYRRAAGIFNEIADDLNREAEETTGLLVPEEDDWSVPLPPKPLAAVTQPPAPVDLQMCGRGVHPYGAPDPVTGWRVCLSCGQVNVTPPKEG